MFLRVTLSLICVCVLSGFGAENGSVKKPNCCPFEVTYTPMPPEAQNTVKIAAGKPYGSYWNHASWLLKQVKAQAKSTDIGSEKITQAPMETFGPLHNLAEVLQGKATLAYSNLSMVKTVEAALDAPKPTLCVAFPLYETPLTWVTTHKQGSEKAEINSLSELPTGFGFGVGPEHSSTDWMFRQILTLLGRELTSDLNLTNGSWLGLQQQFDSQTITGLAYAAGVPNPQIKRLFRKSDYAALLRVKGFTPEEMTLIQDKLHLHPFLILENTYQNQIAPINSAAFWNYAITQCQINSELIYDLTRLAMSTSGEPPKPQLANLSEESTDSWRQTGGIPFHPAAIRYFKEQGIDLTGKN